MELGMYYYKGFSVESQVQRLEGWLKIMDCD